MTRSNLSLRSFVPVLFALAAIPLVISCARESAPPPAELTRGEEGYLAYCAMCHGENGAGNGPLAAALREQDATVPVHLDSDKLQAMGIEEVKRIIREGGLHTGRSGIMPAWGERLSPELIDDIAGHVMSLVTRRPETPRQVVQDFLAAPPGSAGDGRRLYVTYCSICHGPEARGDGFYADTLRMRNNIRPADLTDTERFRTMTDEQLYVTIALGGGHGGLSQFMPAWNVTLPPDQIRSLVSYVRAISNTTGAAADTTS